MTSTCPRITNDLTDGHGVPHVTMFAKRGVPLGWEPGCGRSGLKGEDLEQTLSGVAPSLGGKTWT